MKISLARTLIVLVIGAGLVLISLVVYTVNEFENYCEEGAGLTTIKVKVKDINTRSLIDSIQIIVRYGASMDKVVDTLLNQGNELSYSFIVPDDCEPYWLELSNKYYWDQAFSIDTISGVIDTLYHADLKKGELNEFVAYLKPATVIELNLERELKNNNPDTVFVDAIAAGHAPDRWTYFSKRDFRDVDSTDIPIPRYVIKDFNGKRRISMDFAIEADNLHRSVQWIRKEQSYVDTVFAEFRAIPFDTVRLHYEFKRSKKN